MITFRLLQQRSTSWYIYGFDAVVLVTIFTLSLLSIAHALMDTIHWYIWSANCVLKTLCLLVISSWRCFMNELISCKFHHKLHSIFLNEHKWYIDVICWYKILSMICRLHWEVNLSQLSPCSYNPRKNIT